MGYRQRIYFTARQKAEIWDRWQRGESMSSIGRRFDRNSSSIFPLLVAARVVFVLRRAQRSRLALTLCEREEISRWAEGTTVPARHRPSAASCPVDDQP